MAQQTVFHPLGGGMDLVTPAIALPPGRVVASLNYEPVAAGYRRLRGYERFDGSPRPQERDYYVVPFVNGQNGPAGIYYYRFGKAGSSGGALFDLVVTGGTWAEGNATGLMAYILEGGLDLNQGDWIQGDAGIEIAQASADASLNGADFPEEQRAAWRLLATEIWRQAIQPVPGTGPVRGIWSYGGQVFAVRDSWPDALMGWSYKAEPGGWQYFNLGRQIHFHQGGPVGSIEDGDVLAVQASGFFFLYVSVVKIRVTSGSWAAGTAAGIIYYQGYLPSYDPGGGIRKAGVDIATIVSAEMVTLAPGGRYEFLTHNFYGAADHERMYFVNGVGPAFEYDGATTTALPIETGMAVDMPTHIAAHRSSLFLSFPGGSIQFSQVGDPRSFDPVVGAGEIGIGDEVADFVSANSGTLAILGTNSINVLYGSDSGDYQLEVLTREAGALSHTAQKIGQLVYMDNRGLRSLEASQAYGNFAMGTLSGRIATLLEDYRRDGVRPVASMVCRTADQYWLFFDNGTGIIAYMGGKEPAILPIDLGRNVTCAASVEVEGEERLFIGCDNGFVYELNKGTSFDGDPIEHYLRLPFNHFGSPRQRKRIHRIAIDLEASGTTCLSVSADLDYGAAPGIEPQQLVVTTGGGAIDSLGSNELYFASQIETRAIAHVDGVARNISLKIGGLTANEEPHILTGVTFHLSPRGLQR